MSVGGGRSTIWIHPTIPVQFNFLGSRQPALNRAWLDALIVSANSVDGLRLVEEPAEAPAAAEATEPAAGEADAAK